MGVTCKSAAAKPSQIPSLLAYLTNEMVWGRSEVTFRLLPRWKNANKAKENFTEVKLLPTASTLLRPHAGPPASWRIAKKPIGQLHCRGSCLSIFISLPASLRWANCSPPLQNGVWQGQFFMAKKEPVFLARSVPWAQTLLLLIFVWSWKRLDNIHNTR